MQSIRGRLLGRPLGAALSRRCNTPDPLLAASLISGNSNINETKGIADSKHGLGALNRTTSSRWLWNEQQQLASRSVKFDLTALLQLAAAATASRSCTQVSKISDGQYNKVYQLTMDDGREFIAKFPNPNAGRPHLTTASEVATMDFLGNALNIPVPRVYAWSSRASQSPLGAEYILMEKLPGVVLTDVWHTMKGKQKVKILDQIVDIERRLARTRFTKFGSLYYRDDLPNSPDPKRTLYHDLMGNQVGTKTFAMGPTNHPSFFDFGRGQLTIDRGPWSTLTDYMTAIVQREIESAKSGFRYPLMPEGLFYGPRQYQPTLSKKLSALENYLKVAPDVLPEDKTTHVSVLWHDGLHSQNIFVDSEDPSRIVGIIGWQSVSACPLFMQAGRPAFLDYNGPTPKDLGKVPLPPNFDSMHPDEQRKAKALRLAQTLHNIYLDRCLQQNKPAFEAIQGQNTLQHQVSVAPGLVSMDYEPLLNSLLRDVEKEWAHIDAVGNNDIPRGTPFPLRFSDEEIQEQERDGELWAQGVELMDAFVGDTGCFKHWDGRVSDADYERSRKELDEGVERFLDREARNEEERMEWLKSLVFVDQGNSQGEGDSH
ncbi:phosphotransferase enzyme family protein [Aspergillus sclerotioniger CBS 115572]|uniref:Phosphotransferase enzyme family protein n=1 Tax=Aspergillus sclerotioniger CBS 115572 TaxID=1450535 RepID=A0A317VNU1_9EURO|nr:phosphotransferase enzyme family protein [Aspergillus sclerotioniger CBS 115572]PWY76013.1 phosphotransferase enzyme family protein [Aspergillus sclerotioniger CBS 115572]